MGLYRGPEFFFPSDACTLFWAPHMVWERRAAYGGGANALVGETDLSDLSHRPLGPLQSLYVGATKYTTCECQSKLVVSFV